MGNERSDRFHLAGFGADIRGAISLVAIRHVVVQVEGKLGYINMPDIKTTLNNKPDKASQDFVYGEVDFGIGYTFNTKSIINKAYCSNSKAKSIEYERRG